MLFHFRRLALHNSALTRFLISAYAAATSMAHSHSPWTPETDCLIRAFSHYLIIIRDPRDVAVSWSRWIFTPFNRLHRPTLHPTPEALLAEDLPKRVTEWNTYHQSWLTAGGACLSPHVVFYEQLVDDTPRELGRIARYLGLNISEDSLRRVPAQHALGEMKKRQPHHVFRGGWGGWLEHLDDRQIHTSQRICGVLLKSLGYPLNRADSSGWTPDRLRVTGRNTTPPCPVVFWLSRVLPPVPCMPPGRRESCRHWIPWRRRGCWVN